LVDASKVLLLGGENELVVSGKWQALTEEAIQAEIAAKSTPTQTEQA
jgi:hypothetical protein